MARLGGDEFGVVLIGREADMEATAGACADRLIAELSRPISVGGFVVEIGASIGLAVFPRDSRDADTLFRCADMALYQAKQTARGTWSTYSVSLGQAAELKAALESEVRRAVADGEIQPCFQPIVDMQPGKVVKLEMLARWQHVTYGAVRAGPLHSHHRAIRPDERVHAVDAEAGLSGCKVMAVRRLDLDQPDQQRGLRSDHAAQAARASPWSAGSRRPGWRSRSPKRRW